MNSAFIHKPVFLKEVVEYLNVKTGDKIIDSTINGGGHATAVLEKIGKTGSLIGIELDPEVFKLAQDKFLQNGDSRVILVNDNFAKIEEIAEEQNFKNPNGILFDLGVSSFHFDISDRGFTFQKNQPLDMRIDKYGRLTAKEIVNEFSQKELLEILKKYSGERFAYPITKNIINARKNEEISTTGELVEIIERSVPWWYKKKRINPATKTFQALRIAVNMELDNLIKGLAGAIKILSAGGRIIVISFHELEDRIAKHTFKDWQTRGLGNVLTKRPVAPTEEEESLNPRSRSAKLRAFQKKS